MPKVSEEHKERRRVQILDAAQRVFARHGFEGATVARLEGETGLSRGAIFSYFENKDDLFVAVVAQSSDRLVAIWMEHGFRALLDAIAHEDPDWLAVQLEAARRVRTDPGFRSRIGRLEEEAKALREERLARLRPGLRDDLPLESTVMFLNFVANAFAFARVIEDKLPDLDVLMELVETGVAPRR
jgi:TetR/AcrR family transcriptional regulator, transcriptional repressor of aconitase